MSAALADAPPFIVEHSTCERYTVRRREGAGDWSIFLLDERGGVLSVQSDYGDYAYCWPRHGRASFKHFLCELDTDYLIDKLGGRPEYFNGPASIKQVKRRIIEARRERREVSVMDSVRGRRYVEVDRRIAREAWDAADALAEVAGSGGGSSDLFYDRMMADSRLAVVLRDDFYDLAVYEPKPHLRMFVERLWPAFVHQLRQELGLSEGVTR